ncbi:hypothetical protein [Vibrio sp. 16]|uniref:hypothetical protein n=1 Tax=Vibrio sp. 16 TaxID=391586 RepID=UPI00018F1DE5|nr:hypothetical protein [Vibrio sp. 16]EED25403.1 hypothetical protein VPMS16_2773 [Vibrio sp. 16]CAK4076552.1 hypothetical protein PVDT1_33 [Vibrio sp. 16]
MKAVIFSFTAALSTNALAAPTVVQFSPYVNVFKTTSSSELSLIIRHQDVHLDYDFQNETLTSLSTLMTIKAPLASSYDQYTLELSVSDNHCYQQALKQTINVTASLDGVPIALGTSSRFSFNTTNNQEKWRPHQLKIAFPKLPRSDVEWECRGFIGFTAELVV